MNAQSSTTHVRNLSGTPYIEAINPPFHPTWIARRLDTFSDYTASTNRLRTHALCRQDKICGLRLCCVVSLLLFFEWLLFAKYGRKESRAWCSHAEKSWRGYRSSGHRIQCRFLSFTILFRFYIMFGLLNNDS